VKAAAVIAVMGHEFRIGFPFQSLLCFFLSQEDEVIELGGVVAVTVRGKPDGDLGENGQSLDGAAVRVVGNSDDHSENSFFEGDLAV
jgi:hypothetical protein